MAITGEQLYAGSLFTPGESVMHGGVLFSLPSLVGQGLFRIFEVFKPLPPGFYGLHHIVLTLCFMALCRIKNPEQLKKVPAGEFGKVIGLDRIPQVEYFREKVRQITDQCRCDELHGVLFEDWVQSMGGDEPFFYIDGHVRVYSGELARLPKHFVSREKLCLSSTVEFYVNNFQGLPLMVVTGELNERLKGAIEESIEKIKAAIPIACDPQKPHFTLVFDREAYEPSWFVKLWEKHRVAVVTYRKNVKDKWDDNLFKSTEVQLSGNKVAMRLCEMGSQIRGHWFREVRKLSEGGHQTSIMTTHPFLEAEYIAARMFIRWTQENFFKYMNANFDFDKMIEYGSMELSNKELTVPNPVYKQLSYGLKKAREKKSRLQSRLYQQMDPQTIKDVEDIKEKKKYKAWVEQIGEYEREIELLLAERKGTHRTIRVQDMPEEQRYNKLKTESKKLKNIILMIAYRAESALYALLPDFYKNASKDGRELLKDIFSSEADFIPDYDNKILKVRLHSLSTMRANQAVKKLCDFLNQTKTIYPYTDLRLVYETVAT